jgi:hypothetical protein
MNRIKNLALASCLGAISFVPFASAQEAAKPAPAPAAQPSQADIDQDVALLREDLRSHKKQIIASNLKLTDTEATKFWPVYDQYAADQAKLGDEKYALIKEYAEGYGKVSDEQALSLAKRASALEEKIAHLRVEYVPKVAKVLPGVKTATFFQIDRRIGALIDLQLAKELPLVQDQGK